MVERRGDSILEHERTVMITVKIAGLQEQMDMIASLLLQGDELCYIASLWAQETYPERFSAQYEHLLIRKLTDDVCGKMTLREMDVENNECFYLL